MTFRFHLLALLLASLLPAFLSAAERTVDQDDLIALEGISWRVVEERADGLVFEVVNTQPHSPPPTLTRLDAHQWIATPPGARAVFEALEVEWVVEWDQETEGPLAMDGTSMAGGMPTDFSQPRAHALGDFRGVGLLSCRVGVATAVYAQSPSYMNGMAVLRRGRYAVTFEGEHLDEAASPANLEMRDPYLLDMAGQLFLNAAQVPALVREVLPLSDASPVAQWNRQLAEAADRAPVALLKAAGNGWYRVDEAALQAAGLSFRSWNTANLAAFVGNEPAPIQIETRGDGALSAVSLWVPRRESPGAAFVPVWLMETDDAAPRLGSSPNSTAISLSALPRAIATVFTPNRYAATYPSLPQTSRWATAIASPGGDLRVRFDAPSRDESQAATLTVWLGGNRDTFAARAHVYLNGERLAENLEIAGNAATEFSYEVSPGLLRETGNLLVATFESGPGNVPQEELVLPQARIDYPVRSMVADNLSLKLSDVEESFTLSASTGRFLDITHPTSPRWLSGGEDLEDGSEIVAVDVGEPRAFDSIKAVVPRDLLAPTEGADMVIVTSASLREAAEEYAQYRRSDTRRVAVVTMDEIHQVFSYGWTTDGALRAALAQAFAGWPGRRLSQVLLIGEASEYWWQIDHPRADVAPNLVPVQGYAHGETIIRGDDGHAIIAGAGRLADLEIGRIPAESPQEVRRVLSRVRTYETNPPPGPWRDRHLLVTDDEEEFTRVAERLVIGSLFGMGEIVRVYLHEFPYEDYFRIFQRKRSVAASNRLLAALNEGSLTATYIGHGAPNIWSGERLFHIRDLRNIANGLRRPLLLAGSCDTAWLDFPIEPVRRSLAERFLLNDEGGAIAVFAPVAGATSHEHDYLLRGFFDLLNERPDWEVGRVTLGSKLDYLLHRQDQSVPSQYVLLGDPALRLAHPTRDTIALEVDRTNLTPGTVAQLQVSGTLAEEIVLPANATVELWLEDRTGRILSPRIPAPLGSSRRFSTTLSSSRALEAGSHALVARLVDSRGDVHRASERLRVDPLAAAIDAWKVTLSEDGRRATLTTGARLEGPEDAPPVVVEVVQVHLDGEETLATIPLTAKKPATWSSSVDLAEGANLFVARAVSAPGTAGRTMLKESSHIVPRSTESIPALDLVPGSLAVEPNPTENATILTLRVANLTDRSLRSVGAELLLLAPEGERRLGQFPRAFTAAPHSDVPMAYRAQELLSPGTHRLRVRMVSLEEGDNDGEDRVSTREVSLEIPPPPNLIIVPESVTVRNASGFRGESVFVSARVRNAGTHPVDSAVTRLYVGLPWDGGFPAPSATGESEVTITKTLSPGEEHDVVLRWDPRPGNPSETPLVVAAGHASSAWNPQDDGTHGIVAIAQRELPNLALLRDEMQLSRELVRPGDVLTLTVPFINDSPEDFDYPFIIDVRAQGPLVDDAVVFQYEVPGLAAGERLQLPVTWHTDGKRTRLYAVVNEEREFGERRGDDNSGSRDIAYLLPEENLRHEDNAWTFARDRHLGTSTNTLIDPGDALTIARRPTGGASRSIDNSLVMGEPIVLHGPGTNDDGLMALANNALYWTIRETPPPVRLRVPLPEGRLTDVVDVYLTQLGPGYINIDQSNGYRVRFGGGEWISNPDRRDVEVYFGRVAGSEGFLEVEIAPEGEQTWNTISQIRLVPVQGAYTSPLYEVARFPGGTFAPRFEAPPGSVLKFEVRTAGNPSLDPEFTSWGPINPGLRLPPDPGIRMLQWRVSLAAGPEGNPRLEDAAFEFAPQPATTP